MDCGVSFDKQKRVNIGGQHVLQTLSLVMRYRGIYLTQEIISCQLETDTIN